MPSLRGKIRLACSTLAMIVITLCSLAVFGLLFLKRLVHEGIAVSDLNIAVLEMRRQEKNLFLYGHPDAPGDPERHTETAPAILQEEHVALATGRKLTPAQLPPGTG